MARVRRRHPQSRRPDRRVPAAIAAAATRGRPPNRTDRRRDDRPRSSCSTPWCCCAGRSAELAGLEPRLIAAARAAGCLLAGLWPPRWGWPAGRPPSGATCALPQPPTNQPGDTRDGRVQAERDRRAATAPSPDGPTTTPPTCADSPDRSPRSTDLDQAAAPAVARLHQALGDPDASALPALLAATHHHLPHHPGLAAQVDTVTAHADRDPPPDRCHTTTPRTRAA